MQKSGLETYQPVKKMVSVKLASKSLTYKLFCHEQRLYDFPAVSITQ